MTDITDLVSRIFGAQSSDAVALLSEAGQWPEALWQSCESAGLPLALIESGEHSLDIPVDEAFRIVRLAGQFAAPIPLPETMLANWLLAKSGLVPQPGPLVVVIDDALRFDEPAARLRGRVASVPWGRRAGVVACFMEGNSLRVAYLGRVGFSVVDGLNIAREPRDHLVFDADLAHVPYSAVPPSISGLRLRAAGAALRCNQIAGALQSITSMTVEYSGQRQQFGRPISKFQAVQQSVAVLAAQTAAVSAAADMAADAFANNINLPAIASAKTLAGEAAGVAAGIAHQVHGAMGFSREYALHLRTRRVWSWRDEYGNEAEWSRMLGTQLAARGADSLWAEIAGIQ